MMTCTKDASAFSVSPANLKAAHTSTGLAPKDRQHLTADPSPSGADHSNRPQSRSIAKSVGYCSQPRSTRRPDFRLCIKSFQINPRPIMTMTVSPGRDRPPRIWPYDLTASAYRGLLGFAFALPASSNVE